MEKNGSHKYLGAVAAASRMVNCLMEGTCLHGYILNQTSFFPFFQKNVLIQYSIESRFTSSANTLELLLPEHQMGT